MSVVVERTDMSEALVRYLDIENEDDLTRIVFGILELVGPTAIAEVLGIDDSELSTDVRIQFHARIDQRADRVPDVLLEDSESTVMIEVKRGADVDEEQLRNEHDDLCRFGREEKRLVLVTGHESRPSRLDEVSLEHVEWLGWRNIALRISQYDRSELSDTQACLIELLRTKLETEGYMPFTGFSERSLDELPNIWQFSERYRGHIAKFHRDLEGRLGDQGLQAKNLWRDGVSQDFNRFPAELQLFPIHIWIAYGEPESAINNKDQHYLFVAFCVESRERLVLRVGYSLSPKGNASDRTALIDHADKIVEFVNRTGSHVLSTDRNFNVVDRYGDEAELTSILTDENALSYIGRVQIAREYGSKRLTDPELTAEVADDLVALHEFVTPQLSP